MSQEKNCVICVVGSCNIDQIAYAPRLPVAGETIHGYNYETGFGGKGANQCVAAAKLGAQTAMVAKVGDDANGRSYIENMSKMGVDVTHMSVTDRACTGVAPITVGDDGANSIVVVSGANLLLSPKDIEKAEKVIKMSKVLLCQLELDIKTTFYALKLGYEAGITTILNVAPAVAQLQPEIYEFCSIVCLNETEASLLLDMQVTDIETAKVAAKAVVSKGCQKCVLTLGQDGCVFASSLELEKPVHIQSKPVNAVDTTGAGDAFIGALAYFLAYFDEMSMEQALKRACWVAAESVCRKGTQKSYLTKSELPDTLFQSLNTV